MNAESFQQGLSVRIVAMHGVNDFTNESKGAAALAEMHRALRMNEIKKAVHCLRRICPRCGKQGGNLGGAAESTPGTFQGVFDFKADTPVCLGVDSKPCSRRHGKGKAE
ncbi:hypothetical protein GCM10023213_34800 [Prosthecobacter algae]|uniref:Uncharacterized protein n=1 Tax=Prosthecobacter algae TaxID=1144682 RepID=A0ABP9PG17_9BACT